MDIDFSIKKYRNLCKSIVDNEYVTLTVNEYLSSQKKSDNVIILRHDVDRKIKNALKMGEIEFNFGIKSTYYFRYPFTFDPITIKKINSYGHEVGYHYEVLSKEKGDYTKAFNLFKSEIEEFRKICEIHTICMHGSPLSKFDNRDIWKIQDYRDYGIQGEATLSLDNIPYITDTGHKWNSKSNIRDHTKITEMNKLVFLSTDHIIQQLNKQKIKNLYMNVHPERWTHSMDEWIIQYLKDVFYNMGKFFLKRVRD